MIFYFQFRCELCSYEAGRKDKLKQHIKTVHDRVRYACSMLGCDYNTPRADKLRRHVAVVHQGIVYQCELCSYRAARPDKLKNHMLSHQQQRHPGVGESAAASVGGTLSCQLCQFRTISAAELAAHKSRANHQDRTNGGYVTAT
jgi:hypothetical protein